MRAYTSTGMAAAKATGELQEAYAVCERLARKHYENFSIATVLLPRDLRRHMYPLYAYCRGVDDLGDESPGDRLKLLEDWERQLVACYTSRPSAPQFVALQATIRERDLPIQPFLNLIAANRQDQLVGRYRTYADLMQYCSLSANPVGRLVLYLWGYRNPALHSLSDYTCTALQLANFWQDVARDLAIGRLYIPLEDLEAFAYTEDELRAGVVDERFRSLMRFEVERTRQLFRRGIKLAARVAASLRADLLLFTHGGLELLSAIEDIDYDVLNHRPTVSNRAKARLFLKALVTTRLLARG